MENNNKYEKGPYNSINFKFNLPIALVIDDNENNIKEAKRFYGDRAVYVNNYKKALEVVENHSSIELIVMSGDLNKLDYLNNSNTKKERNEFIPSVKKENENITILEHFYSEVIDYKPKTKLKNKFNRLDEVVSEHSYKIEDLKKDSLENLKKYSKSNKELNKVKSKSLENNLEIYLKNNNDNSLKHFFKEDNEDSLSKRDSKGNKFQYSRNKNKINKNKKPLLDFLENINLRHKADITINSSDLYIPIRKTIEEVMSSEFLSNQEKALDFQAVHEYYLLRKILSWFFLF